jgi:O-antigen/teichoic acid export membrane protein
VTGSTYLIGIVTLTVTGNLSISSVLLLGAVNPLIGYVVGLRLLPPGLLAIGRVLSKPARRAWGELAGFSRWMWVSAILSLLAAQLDLILLSLWAPAATIGIYALAFTLAQKLDLINQARLTALLPVASALRTRSEIGRYTRRSLARGLLLALGLALVTPLLGPFITTFYGPEFADSAGIVLILMVVVLFDLVTSPLCLLGFALGQPRALAGADAVRVATLVVTGVLLIPSFGPIGAALARLAGRVSGALFILAVLRLQILRMPWQQPGESYGGPTT